MHPVLFELNGFNVDSYSFFFALGYLAAVITARKLAFSQRMEPNTFSLACLVALVTGLIGARLLFALTNWSHFAGSPSSLLSINKGGLVFYGGLLLAIPSCMVFFVLKRIPLAAGFDLLVPSLAFGHAIGRLGCFFAGCCHGRLCEAPWAVQLHSSLVEPSLKGLPLHPTQLYEAGSLFFMGLLAAVSVRKKLLKPGKLTLLFLCSYAALRFGVEEFRGDSIRGTILGLSTSQAIAVPLFLSCGWLLFRGFRSDH